MKRAAIRSGSSWGCVLRCIPSSWCERTQMQPPRHVESIGRRGDGDHGKMASSSSSSTCYSTSRQIARCSVTRWEVGWTRCPLSFTTLHLPSSVPNLRCESYDMTIMFHGLYILDCNLPSFVPRLNDLYLRMQMLAPKHVNICTLPWQHQNFDNISSVAFKSKYPHEDEAVCDFDDKRYVRKDRISSMSFGSREISARVVELVLMS